MLFFLITGSSRCGGSLASYSCSCGGIGFESRVFFRGDGGKVGMGSSLDSLGKFLGCLYVHHLQKSTIWCCVLPHLNIISSETYDLQESKRVGVSLFMEPQRRKGRLLISCMRPNSD